MMNVEEIFNGFVTVNDEKIPVERLRYYGDSETYVTYMQYDHQPAFSADDSIQTSIIYYDFDIYTKNNWRAVAKALNKKLKDNGYMWRGTQSEQFDDDTKTYHVTVEFCIEEAEE